MTCEAPTDFWEKFGQPNEVYDEVCGRGNLSTQVLDNFGIPYTNGSIGASVTNLDIKHMDAIQLIKLSLMEYSADNGGLYELTVNEEGEVDFINVGEFDGMGDCNIYNTIQTFSYVSKKAGVLITGAKPLLVRKPVEWKSIWAESEVEIYDTEWLNSSCNAPSFSRHATIVFNDPHMTAGTESYGNGISDFYESKTPWESIIGYARYICWPDMDNSPDTVVQKNDSAVIPLLLDEEGEVSLGILRKRPTARQALENVNSACFDDMQERISTEGGVKLNIPGSFRFESIRGTKVDKFAAINKVYIVGQRISALKGIPASDGDAITQGESKILAYIEDTTDLIYELEIGKHYQIAYSEVSGVESQDIYIVFANNAHENDHTEYGTNVNFTIDYHCPYYSILPEGDTDKVGCILPHDEHSGYWVKQVFVAVELQTPSITIYDPAPLKAMDIARSLSYLVTPLVVVDNPPPIAFNGQLIDQSSAEVDHDPTTIQDFSKTDLEIVYDTMDGGAGYTLSMSFLTEEQVVRLSASLYDILLSDNGTMTVYICSPDSQPQIGGYGPDSDSVVNEINYSYNDSSAYTISVACGSKIVGGDIASIGYGPSYRTTDSAVSVTGTIIEDAGNHVNFKIMVDGYGPIMAINGAPKILRVGDRVSCSIHNNPVEA